jgi:hypothetical protein
MHHNDLGPLAPELEIELRSLIAQGHTIAAIKRLREAMGCGLAEAHAWVDCNFREGGLDFRNERTGTPCPHCGKPLASDKAKQCFSCGMDWHDPERVVRRGDPEWNRFGLKKNLTYVVQLCQKPTGERYTKYREVEGGEPDEFRVFETEPASGSQFIEWGFYEYAEHLRLSNGESFYFDAHGIWLTGKEIEYLQRRVRRTLAQGETPPWVNGIAPRFAPK